MGLLVVGPRQGRPTRSGCADDLHDQIVVVRRERDRRRFLHVLVAAGVADELLRFREVRQPPPPLGRGEVLDRELEPLDGFVRFVQP